MRANSMIARMAGSNTFLRDSVQQARVYIIHSAISVHSLEFAAITIKFDHRLRNFPKNVKTFSDRFLIVVLAMNQLTTGIRTCI